MNSVTAMYLIPLKLVRLFVLLSALSVSLLCFAQPATLIDPHPKAARTAQGIQADDLALLAKVLQVVSEEYVDSKTGHELLLAATRGLVASLDRHSSLIETSKGGFMRGEQMGQFGGIGLELELRKQSLVVVRTMKDSPAAKAGLHKEDEILTIDGMSTQGLSMDDALGRIRGRPGSEVALGLRRTTSDAIETIDRRITREIIRYRTVEVDTLKKDIVFLRIHEFFDMTPADMMAALRAISQDTNLKGIVLDLRDNAGGVVESAIAVASAFLPANTLVMSSRARPHEPPQPYMTAELFAHNRITESQALLKETLLKVPLVVLINRRTASSAEIVASALQDHGRAKIMGCTASMGKGSIQTIIPLTPHYAIKLTTARFFTPTGRSLDSVGVQPDLSPNTTKGTATTAAKQCDEDNAAILEAALRGLPIEAEKTKAAMH